MLISKGQETVSMEFSDLLKKAKQTLLYFYPQDETPGCTLEAITFTIYLQTFLDHGIQVVWVSKDSSESHCKFIEKDGLQIPLISDPDLTLHKQFGARGEKNMYGKIYEGTIRSTFLLAPSGEILKARRNVKATGHVEKVLRELKLAN